jgi:ABC-2 type transport system permease protein
MPYSESIGFITDLTAKEDIDMVFYVVAHETGHQWWAHQVMGADMQGSTLLSESMSQYSRADGDGEGVRNATTCASS